MKWLLLVALTLGGPAVQAATAALPPWPDSFTARVEALALLQTLNAELLSHDSATLTLERWCDAHHLASPAQVRAVRVVNEDKPADDSLRQALQVGPAELIRYRHVRLLCGGVTLSEADNWYVAARLSTQINAALDSSDIPFGKAVQTLHFQRHTIAASLLWSPLPVGWEMGRAVPVAGGRALFIPAQVLQHRAVLSLPDGTPISEVVETYTSQTLGFPPPSRHK